MAVISGLMLTASFPSINMPFLAFICWIPCLFALRQSTFLFCTILCMITGLTHEFTLLYWIVPTLVTHAKFSIMYATFICMVIACIRCCWFVTFGSIIYFFVKKPWHLFVLPFIWVGLELSKNWGSLGFPWALLGYSQWQWIGLIQIADIFGVYGVSGLIMLINVCIFLVVLHVCESQWKFHSISNYLMFSGLGIGTLSIILSLTYGVIRINEIDSKIKTSPHQKIMIVQPNIPQHEKWDGNNRAPITKKMIQMTFAGMEQGVDLVIWPETALPYAFHSKHQLRQYVLDSIKQMQVGLVMGSPSFVSQDGQLKHYNSAYIINKQGEIQSRYNKARLVPFSEYMPYPLLSDLWKLLGAPDEKFVPGRVEVHDIHGVSLGIQICYEIIFPAYARTMTHNGANVLINMSNDAWFGRTACPEQLFSMAVFRAVENKRPLVRAANTGISGMIDPCGRVVSATRIFETNTMICEVPVF